MATTALIVEIIVIGAFALIWVVLFTIKFIGLDISLLSDWLVLYKDWSTGVVLAAVVISYQLGWSVNQISYFFARKTFNKAIKLKVFKDEYKNFESIKATVYMQGSSFAVEKLKERLSVVRLTRSAFMNFLFISIALFTLNNWQMGLAALFLTIILFVQANDIYSLYCNQIFNAFKVIKSSNEKKHQIQGKKRKAESTS